MTGQLWSLATTQVQVRFRVQLNSILFAKTLVRKNIASAGQPNTEAESQESQKTAEADGKDDGDFSTKAQVMTLMTTDVDRVSDFAWHLFSLVGK